MAKKKRLYLRIPATLFDGHKKTVPSPAGKSMLFEGHRIVEFTGSSLVLDDVRQVKGIRVKKDKNGNLYLEFEE